MDIVSKASNMTTQQLKSSTRKRLNVQARSVFAHIAVRNYGFKGVEISKALSSSPPTVSRMVEKGQNVLLCREILATLNEKAGGNMECDV